jgi:carboxymethylenebutenolidase
LAAGVGFYPTFCVTDEPDSPHLSLSRTSGRIYLAFAGADSVVAMDDNRILAAGLDQLGQRASHETFARVNHGFAVPGATFDRDAADRSFQAALKLFTQALAW